jgi:transposase InsO family protein
MTGATGRRHALELETALALDRNSVDPRTKICETCKRRFPSRHPESRWCSDSCRQISKAKW